MENKMSKLATQIVHWPGKDTFACDKHAANLNGLAGAMGFKVTATKLEGYQVPCQNCSNEELESIRKVAERVYPKEVADIDADRIRDNAWYRECDESARLNK